MRILKCITGNTLRDRIRNIYEIQDVIRWLRIRRQVWRDHVNGVDDNQLAKIAKNGKQSPVHLDGLQNIGAKTLDIDIIGEHF